MALTRPCLAPGAVARMVAQSLSMRSALSMLYEPRSTRSGAVVR
jgi:hypothetical protein